MFDKLKGINIADTAVNYAKSITTSDVLLAGAALLLLDIEETQDFIADVTAADYFETHMQ